MPNTRAAFVLAAALAALVPAVAAAAPFQERWTFDDWQLIVENTTHTGEPTTFCTLRTAAAFEASLEVVTSDRDAAPPARQPWVALVERVSPRYRAALRAGADATFMFSTNEAYPAVVRRDRDDNGGRLLVAEIDERDSLAVLRTLARADRASFVSDGQAHYAAGLRGFAEAYRAMAERCGFSAAGVLDAARPFQAAAVSNAAAEPRHAYYEHRDWTTYVETRASPEGLRVNCAIHTGGAGAPALYAAYSDQDAGPPRAFPFVALRESAPRGYRTRMRDGDPALFVFDDGVAIPGVVRAGVNDAGESFAEAQIEAAQFQGALKGMRRARSLLVIAAGQVVARASLNGFTAAYGEMAKHCGFTTAGVLD